MYGTIGHDFLVRDGMKDAQIKMLVLWGRLILTSKRPSIREL